MTDLIRDGNWFEAGLKVDPVRMVRLAQHAGLTGGEKAISREIVPVAHPWAPEGAALIRGSDCWWAITFRLGRSQSSHNREIRLYRLDHDPTECRGAQCVCPPCQDDDHAECDMCSCCMGTCWEDYDCHECVGDEFCDTHQTTHEFTPEEVAA